MNGSLGKVFQEASVIILGEMQSQNAPRAEKSRFGIGYVGLASSYMPQSSWADNERKDMAIFGGTIDPDNMPMKLYATPSFWSHMNSIKLRLQQPIGTRIRT
ncbi:hypothetical protein RJT34_14312 [Clitoria ternatea]|uniref:Uncharacterized protein n=1 Tax=Clitoria ternatea TaxID=43366 RepID=A0AAN9JSX9_CLITE